MAFPHIIAEAVHTSIFHSNGGGIQGKSLLIVSGLVNLSSNWIVADERFMWLCLLFTRIACKETLSSRHNMLLGE